MQDEIEKFQEELENSRTKNGEECCGDFRLFHIEKKSKIFKKFITDEVIFNNIAIYIKNILILHQSGTKIRYLAFRYGK